MHLLQCQHAWHHSRIVSHNQCDERIIWLDLAWDSWTDYDFIMVEFGTIVKRLVINDLANLGIYAVFYVNMLVLSWKNML